jgi:hypothetical protein
MASLAASRLSILLKTEVRIQEMTIGLFNRIIIEDLHIQDQQTTGELLRVARLSARFNPADLLAGRLIINHVQLFGFNANLYRVAPDSVPNYTFLLDAFASKDSIDKSPAALDVRVNTLLIRRGRIQYDVYSEPETPEKFNPHHLNLQNIAGDISIRALRSDSVNLQIRRFGCMDVASGFTLQRLALRVTGNGEDMKISDFVVELPHSHISTSGFVMEADSVAGWTDVARNVTFRARSSDSYLTPSDFSAFIPALAPFRDSIALDIDVEGTLERLVCHRLSLRAASYLQLDGNGTVVNLMHPAELSLSARLRRLSLTSDGVNFLFSRLSPQQQTMAPPVLQRMGNLFFQGEMNGRLTELHLDGALQTDLGDMRYNATLLPQLKTGKLSYVGRLSTDGFALGQLLDNNAFGQISMDVQVDTHFENTLEPRITVNGTVGTFEYKNYTYENIQLTGLYENSGFDGHIVLDDANGSVDAVGKFQLNRALPIFDFTADLHEIRPYDLHLLDERYQGDSFSLRLKANFTGHDIDDMVGVIAIDSLLYNTPDEVYRTPHIRMQSLRRADKTNLLTVESDFMNAHIEGIYSYETLPNSLLNIAKQYVPALFPPDERVAVATNNNFSFRITMQPTRLLPIVFKFPLEVYTSSSFQGYCNDVLNRMKLEAYIPQLQYKGDFFRSGLLSATNDENRLRGQVRFGMHRKNGTILNVALNMQATDNQMEAKLYWGNDGMNTYGGELDARARFSRDPATDKAPLQGIVNILPTEIIINDTVWNVREAQIRLNEGIEVEGLGFSHAEQYLQIDGRVSENEQDTLRMALNDISIEYVFDVLNFHAVDFKGHATGVATGVNLLKTPELNTRLSVRNFRFNDALMGDMTIGGRWDEAQKGVWLAADIQDERSQIGVTGYIFPLRPNDGLDLTIRPTRGNVHFIERYVGNIVSNVSGNVTGTIRLHGLFDRLDIEGGARLDTRFYVNTLGTSLLLQDSITLRSGNISFNNIRFSDTEGHIGHANGRILHNHLRNFDYRADLSLENVRVMDLAESTDLPFYGTVYATGTGTLRGNDNEGLNLDANLTTNVNSTFTYALAPTMSAISNSFVTFNDKTPRREMADSLSMRNISGFEQDLRRAQSSENSRVEGDVRLNLQVDATPDATIRIVLDPMSGDYITGRGTGNVNISYYNKGDVQMRGTYTLSQGQYKFSLQDVIRKDFTIRDGSSITFNGNPLDAALDIQTGYMVNSVSLNDLIPDASAVAMASNVNVRVNCLMNLAGTLTHPTLDLGIELPYERSEVQDLVRNYIPTDEDMNMQIIYLLGVGKFYPPNFLASGQNSNVMSSVLSSTLSGQFNNLLSRLIDNNNWNVGTNLSTGELGWTDMEVEAILSGRLLNNRLLINGNFGYRENALTTTNFVGDFDAELLLTRTGDLRLKAYNQSNDRYYTRSNLTTQGVGIVYKRDFQRWRDLWFWLRRKEDR